MQGVGVGVGVGWGGGGGVKSIFVGGVGVMFLKWWPTWSVWAGFLIFASAITKYVWIIRSFRIWGYLLHVETFHESSRIVVNICESPLRNSSLWLAGEKHNQKFIIPIFRLVLQNFALPGCFRHTLCCPNISPYFLLVGMFLQYVALCQSRELVKW